MRREYSRRPQPLQRRVSREVPVLDELAQPLELQERRVALVHVEDGRVEPEAAEHAHPADAEHEFLPEPVLAVASVELVGDRARPVRVTVDVGVEQVERHTPDLRTPDLHPHGHEHARVVGQIDRRGDLLEPERQPRGVVLGIALCLPVGLVELLAEVALAVEEADADEWHAEIGRRLQVIARQHAEAARVDRQALVEPELAGEVRDAEPVILLAPFPPGRASRLGLRRREHALEAFDVLRRRAGSQLLVGECVDERDRVVIQRLEALGIEILEEGACARKPAEPEVAGDRAQGVAHGRGAIECAHRLGEGFPGGAGDKRADYARAPLLAFGVPGEL